MRGKGMRTEKGKLEWEGEGERKQGNERKWVRQEIRRKKQ